MGLKCFQFLFYFYFVQDPNTQKVEKNADFNRITQNMQNVSG